MTLAEIRAADLLRVWYDTQRGLAVSAESPNGTIPVRFTNQAAEAIGPDIALQSVAPVARVRDSDAGNLVAGAELVIATNLYRVVGIQPGDHGERVLQLEAI